MALRALDGSANAGQWKTTLKVVPGAEDNFAIGCWTRVMAYEATASVSARIFHWRNSGNWDHTQCQIITGSDASPSYYWDRRITPTIVGNNIKSGAPDSLWRFSIYRAVSVTNHRSVTIDPAGSLYSVADATTDLSGIDTSTINELVFGWDTASAAKADIAEFWITAGDPFKGLTDVPRGLMYYIAHNGPYSYEPVRGRLQFYASFEEGLRSDRPGHYVGAAPLAYSSGVQTGNRSSFHPPLAPGYLRPADPILVGVV